MWLGVRYMSFWYLKGILSVRIVCDTCLGWSWGGDGVRLAGAAFVEPSARCRGLRPARPARIPRLPAGTHAGGAQRQRCLGVRGGGHCVAGGTGEQATAAACSDGAAARPRQGPSAHFVGHGRRPPGALDKHPHGVLGQVSLLLLHQRHPWITCAVFCSGGVFCKVSVRLSCVQRGKWLISKLSFCNSVNRFHDFGDFDRALLGNQKR